MQLVASLFRLHVMRILNEKLWAKTEKRRATQHKTYENRPSSREARRSYREKFYFWVRKLFLRFARASFREAFAVDVSQKDKLLLLAGTWTLFILSKAVKPFSSVGGVTEKNTFHWLNPCEGGEEEKNVLCDWQKVSIR